MPETESVQDVCFPSADDEGGWRTLRGKEEIRERAGLELER